MQGCAKASMPLVMHWATRASYRERSASTCFGGRRAGCWLTAIERLDGSASGCRPGSHRVVNSMQFLVCVRRADHGPRHRPACDVMR